MNIKIAVIQASLITSCVMAQELQWIRRYPDVVSFANSPYSSDGAAYGFDNREGKVIVFANNFHPSVGARNFFYYDGQNFTIANLFTDYSQSQKNEICSWVAYRSQVVFDIARNTLNFSRENGFASYNNNNNRWTFQNAEFDQQYLRFPADDYSGNKFCRFVYDTNRNVIVGIASSPWSSHISEYDGSIWRVKYVDNPVSPSGIGRNFNAVFDSQRNKTVIFGGFSLTDHNRTYEYDGNTVVQRDVPSPPPRYNHLMTYDSNLHKVVVFGGGHITNQQNNAGLVLTDTWTFDGNQWVQLNTQFTGTQLPNNGGTWYEANPSTFNLVYDSVRKTHVLLGPSYDANRSMVYLERCELVPTCNQPVITHQPVDQFVPYGAVVTFFAQANNGTVCNYGITYQWQRRNPNVEDENAPLAWFNLQDDGIFANTTTSTLTVQSPMPAVATGYRCVVTNGCACYDGSYRSVNSNVVNFAVSCPSDFNADGGVDFNDVEAFFERWENGC